jgi:hypothetical protein
MKLFDIFSEVNDAIKDFRFPISGWEGGDYLNEDYHKWLAFYVKLYKPKRILEMGRRWGNSLYSLSFFLNDSSVLDSYDILDIGRVVCKPNVNVMIYDGNFSKLNLVDYDFIFVDINGIGELETKFLNTLIVQNFKGLVAWDDIGSKWVPDEFFWNNIPSGIEKLKCDLHFNNFGLTLHK